MKVKLISPDFSNATGQGVGRVSYGISRRLKQNKILVDETTPQFYGVPGKRHIENLIISPIVSKFGKRDVTHFLLPEQVGCFFSFKNTVTTFHDLIHTLSPEIPPFFAKKYTHVMKRASKISKKIVAVSTQTKKEIIEQRWANKEKIEVVSNGVGSEFTKVSKGKKAGNVVGYVGGLGKRKNVVRMIKEFDKKKGELVIWGGGKSKIIIGNLAKKQGARYMGFAPQEELVKIYNSFDAFFFPSKYEGFGLPILEAVACEVPVFTYRDSKIPKEVKSLTTTVKNTSEVFELINSVSKTELSKRARKVKQEFSWDNSITKLIEIYEEVMGL